MVNYWYFIILERSIQSHYNVIFDWMLQSFQLFRKGFPSFEKGIIFHLGTFPQLIRVRAPKPVVARECQIPTNVRCPHVPNHDCMTFCTENKADLCLQGS